MTKTETRNLRNGLLFASPWLIGFTVLIGYPVIASFYYSLCYYDAISSPKFIGFGNYTTLLFHDPLFWKSLYNTIYMVFLGLPIGLIASLALAIFLNQKVRGLAFYRTIYYLPSITPVVALSILWLWLFNPQMGLINTLLVPILRQFNLSAPGWLDDPFWAKPALIFMGVWGVGNTIIIFLAGLQDVPQQLYESAEIDGATAWRKLWHITLPMLSPVIFFNVIMGIIGSFQYFTQVWIMTRGGPQDTTLFYALYLFNNAFLFSKMGYASAMAWVLFLITLLCTITVFKSSARWIYYAGETK
ncbi:MAG: carbohydrate ABC transporter permease [bacterium]